MVMVARMMPDTKKLRSFHQNGKLHILLMGMKHAVENFQTSGVILNDGKSGYGKTTISLQEGITLDPTFNLDRVYFTPESFLAGLANAKKGQAFCFDEALLVSSRSALSSVNKAIVISMSMIRSKQIYVIFNINSVFDLDRNLVLSRADCLVHVYADSAISPRKIACFFKAVKQEDRLKLLYLYGKKYYSYSKPRANFTGNFPKEFIINEKEYNQKKDQAINDYLRGDTSTSPRSNISRDNLMIYLKDKYKASPKKIAEVSGLGISRVYEILKNDGNAR